MFLEYLLLLLRHCFCLLHVLEMGQGFMHEDHKGGVGTPAYTNTLVYPQAEEKHEEQHS